MATRCSDCGCVIPKNRILAIKDANRCVNCQMKFEKCNKIKKKVEGLDYILVGSEGVRKPNNKKNSLKQKKRKKL